MAQQNDQQNKSNQGDGGLQASKDNHPTSQNRPNDPSNPSGGPQTSGSTIGSAERDANAQRTTEKQNKALEDRKDDSSEGRIHELRDAANVNGLAGHESNIAEWEASEAGQEFINETAKENEKAIEEEAKALEASANKAAEAQEEYRKSVDQARKDADNSETNK